MAERYTRLYSLPENLYTPGAPVVIAAGALLKDNQTGKTLAQIKFKSISEKQIKAIKVSVSAFDVSGKELESVAEYQYLDLTATRNAEFGQKQAVPLPNAVTRSFDVKCTDVFFGDGTVWNAPANTKWLPLPAQASITSQLGELAAQYQRDTSPKSKFIPIIHEDLWFCSCGTINHENESACYNCRADKDQLFAALNQEILQQHKAAFDQAKAEKEKAEAEKAAKKAAADKVKRAKTMKLAAAAVLVVVLALLTTKFIIPPVRYNKALAVMEAGRYQEAEQIFVELGDFKDSEWKSVECNNAHKESEKRNEYNNAIALMDAGEYEQAISAFSELANYEDSSAKIKECEQAKIEAEYRDQYDVAVTLMDEEKYAEAIAIFKTIPGCENSVAECKTELLKSATLGDYIYYGTYEQDYVKENGKELIEWLVLDEKDGKILVISKYGLTSKRYHETVEDVTWETCTLRNWLNSDFVDEAFSKEEKQRIPTMKIEAGRDPFTNVSEGNDTQDQVFLLSVIEVEKYFSSNDAKKCETTLYAKIRNPTNTWWLRTPGVDPEPNGAELYVSPYRYQNTFVNDNGIINNGGWTTHDMIVRPAMWIDISSFG